MKLRLNNMEIKKCLEKTDGTKYIIVPKSSEIKSGDYVSISKVVADILSQINQIPEKNS